MHTQVYETIPADRVTDAILGEAATLFNENYGVWGEKSGKPGHRVKFSTRRLRAQLLPAGSTNCYTRVHIDGTLAAHAFCSRWTCAGKTVCWVTQLVVGTAYRRRGVATKLVGAVGRSSDDVFGILSSHPAACLALVKSFGSTVERLSLDFIAANAKAVMETSPIAYIRDAKLRGSLFGMEHSGLVAGKDSGLVAGEDSALIAGADTRFFVDHAEPVEALKSVCQVWAWPLGNLPEGHEYLVLLPARRRASQSIGEA